VSFYLKAEPSGKVVEYFRYESVRDGVKRVYEDKANEALRAIHGRGYSSYKAELKKLGEAVAKTEASNSGKWQPSLETPKERRARKRAELGIELPPPHKKPVRKPKSDVKIPPDPPDYPVEPELVGVNPDYELDEWGLNYIKKKGR